MCKRAQIKCHLIFCLLFFTDSMTPQSSQTAGCPHEFFYFQNRFENETCLYTVIYVAIRDTYAQGFVFLGLTKE